MKRAIAFVLLLAALGYFFFQQPASQSSVLLTDARAMPVGQGQGHFMISLKLDNKGNAAAVTGVSTPSNTHVSIMNPGNKGRPLVVPAMGQAQFAMDGAHIMLHGSGASVEPGAILPIEVSFSDGSEAKAQVTVAEGGTSGMGHSMSNGVTVSPSPAVTILPSSSVSDAGFDVQLNVENFTFVQVEDGAPHVDGQGHAHVYLNGLKLGRLYEQTYTLGALVPGDYVLRVGLNTNDHRPYLNAAGPVEAILSFSITQ